MNNDSPRRAALPILVMAPALLAAASLFAGCSAPEYEALPPQTVTTGPGPAPATDEGFATPPVEPVTQPAVELDPAPTAATRDLVVVIEGDLGETNPPVDERSELLRASQAERARRATAPPPVLVITDENLAELAAGAHLTIGGAPAKTEIDEDALYMAADEAYWRNRVREVRLEWREAYDSIEEIEAQAAELRVRFYSQDDPAYRDRVIKPEWDRALDRLGEARRTVAGAQERLSEVIDEGARAGAFPGWLRDGIELEPLPEEPVESELETADPQEPKVIEPPRAPSPR